ncbi:MAG: hypothetical protein JO337_06630 [Acidimicrobiales bacterium]|nr:hypothetical protein [Acidimicrobiales bacterium]
MRCWELWEVHHPDGAITETFCPEDDQQAHREVEQDGAQLVWTVEARGMNDAMRQMYEYKGWAEYQPPLRDGTPYPQDEER